MRYFFKVLFSPKSWRQKHGHYSPEWDTKLNSLMEVYEFVHVTESMSSLGGIQIVWKDGAPLFGCCRPKRSTILRAMDKYIKEVGN